jgi:hypothetical protein
MTDFHTHCIPSGLPDLTVRSGNSRWPVHDQPTGGLMISGEAIRALPASGYVSFGTDYPLPVHADAAGSIMDSLDRAEAAWVREGTASALLSLQ